jgi:hypothetical protein
VVALLAMATANTKMIPITMPLARTKSPAPPVKRSQAPMRRKAGAQIVPRLSFTNR